jgi:hypothetical protein
MTIDLGLHNNKLKQRKNFFFYINWHHNKVISVTPVEKPYTIQLLIFKEEGDLSSEKNALYIGGQ